MSRVLVGMSGGVDSSVAAALLADQGHEVVGVTMKLWGGESDSGCCSVSDVDDARRVADQLGIEHHVFNFGDDFTEHVIDPYVAAHAAGLTPNPCIECNRHLKFDRLLRRAEALGFDLVATGHHARVNTHADGSHRIARGADTAKDQSYVLYMVVDPALAGVVLPLGGMTKDAVRAEAARLGMRTATKPDSQDVCFITSVEGRQGFLEDRIDYTPGTIVDTDGNKVGTVPAVQLVTIGQRRGLELAGGAGRRYVVDVNVPEAKVTIGPSQALHTNTVVVRDLVWSTDMPANAPVQTSAHGATRHASLAEGDVGTVVVTFDEPLRRIAPGQSVVFYDSTDTEVVGGGIAAVS